MTGSLHGLRQKNRAAKPARIQPSGPKKQVGESHHYRPMPIYAVAFSPDGSLLAGGGRYEAICIWVPTSGKETSFRSADRGYVYALAFSPDGSVLASGGDGTVRLWRTEGKSHESLLATLTRHNLPVRSVAFSPDGKLLASGSDDTTVRLWNPADGTQLRSLTGHDGAVHSVAFSPDGKLLASGSDDTTVRFWV